MTAINVSDSSNGRPIAGATFDHHARDAGGGYYDVDLDLANGDVIFTTNATGYMSRVSDYRITGAFVILEPLGGGGGGSSCF